MTPSECEDLLRAARAVLERHLFDADGELVRDDIAELCMKIDEALSAETDEGFVTSAQARKHEWVEADPASA